MHGVAGIGELQESAVLSDDPQNVFSFFGRNVVRENYDDAHVVGTGRREDFDLKLAK